MARKEELYELSYDSGATRGDSWIDIEGGAGTLFSFSSKGRRELPNGRVLIDGAMEPLSKAGTFVGQHVFTPLQGVAVHINAFNFPVWGMLEKLGPTLLAGVPAIVKPASSTGYLTELAVRIMIEADVLPHGALQLIMGSTGDLLDHLTCQDVVSFTGSAATAMKLQSHPVIARESVRFVAERDSLNASILGPDAAPGTPEFDLFVKEVAREMTVKAGQKCTAIRRAMAPAAASRRGAGRACPSGSPRSGSAIRARRACRWARSPAGRSCARCARRWPSLPNRRGSSRAIPTPRRSPATAPSSRRSCCAPTIPGASAAVHDVEAFGPVSTLMPYRDLDDAIALANRGMGSLALSLFTFDRDGRRGFRARRRRLSRPDGDPRPHQREGIDRPRLPPPRPRPWRPRPRRRRRGDGRHARREALYAAHRAAGLARRAVEDRRPVAARRRPSRPATSTRSASASPSSRSAIR